VDFVQAADGVGGEVLSSTLFKGFLSFSAVATTEGNTGGFICFLSALTGL